MRQEIITSIIFRHLSWSLVIQQFPFTDKWWDLYVYQLLSYWKPSVGTDKKQLPKFLKSIQFSTSGSYSLNFTLCFVTVFLSREIPPDYAVTCLIRISSTCIKLTYSGDLRFPKLVRYVTFVLLVGVLTLH